MPRSALSSASACFASSLEYLAWRCTVRPRSCAATTSGSGRAPGRSGAANTPATWSPRARKASSTALPNACWPTITMRIVASSGCPLGRTVSCRSVRGQAYQGGFVRSTSFACPWQEEGHRGASADLAADRGRAAGLLCKPVHHAEAETGAFARLLARKERLERPRQHFRGHAGAGVVNLKAGKLGGRVRLAPERTARQSGIEGTHPKQTAGRHRIARIYRKVDYGKFELSGIGINLPQIGCKIGFDPDPAPDRASQQLSHLAQDVVEVQTNNRERPSSGKGEQLAGQFLGALDSGERHFYPRLQLLFSLVTAQVFEAALQHRQQVVEVVRHSTRQPAERLHFLSLVELGFRLYPPVHLPGQPLSGGAPPPCGYSLALQLAHGEQGHAQQAERSWNGKQQIINQVGPPASENTMLGDTESDIEWVFTNPPITEEPLDAVSPALAPKHPVIRRAGDRPHHRPVRGEDERRDERWIADEDRAVIAQQQSRGVFVAGDGA